jgi:quinol monooxygenase YgiN
MSHDDSAGKHPTMVRLSGFLRCASMAEVETVQRYLPDHMRLTRAEPGCISFEVSQTDDPLVWRVEELFADQAAFDFHQQRTRASKWFAATSAIVRKYEIFELGRI